jgi:hypothetical protein
MRAGADAIKIRASDACPEEKLVHGIEEGPGALRVDGNVAIELADRCEGVAFSDGDGIFKPIPIFGLGRIENESGFAVGVIVVPLGVTEGLVDAMCVECAHQGLNTGAGAWRVIRRVRPRSEPAAIVELT